MVARRKKPPITQNKPSKSAHNQLGDQQNPSQNTLEGDYTSRVIHTRRVNQRKL